MKLRLAVVFPSRGMNFSRTCEELLRELANVDHKIFFSIGNPLPDCFNIPVNEALQDPSFTHVLIVEDDMILPKGILQAMLDKQYPVVALDYPFRKDGDSTVLHAPDGYALYTGTGFLLIERWLLDKMPKPVFSTDTAWEMLISANNELVIWPLDVSDRKTYGLHDVNFGITMWSNEVPILVLNKTAGQRKLRALGTSGSNNGKHEIYQLTKVRRNNTAAASETDKVDLYLDRVSKIRSIDLRNEAPDYVEYIDGKATVKGNHVVI